MENDTTRRAALEAAMTKATEKRQPGPSARAPYLQDPRLQPDAHPVDKASAAAETLHNLNGTAAEEHRLAAAAGVHVNVIKRLRAAYARKAKPNV